MAVISFGIRLTQVGVPAKLPFYRLCTMYKWSQLSGPPFPILMQRYTNYILSILRIYYVHEIGGGASMRKCIRSSHCRAWHMVSAHKNHRYDCLPRTHEQGESLFWLCYGEVKAWRVGDKEVEGRQGGWGLISWSSWRPMSEKRQAQGVHRATGLITFTKYPPASQGSLGTRGR